MEILHIVEQQCTLHKSYNSLMIKRYGRKIMDVPLVNMKTIIIYGYNQISTQLIHQLSELGIDVHFVSLSGRTKAMLISHKSNSVILRMAQYKMWQDEEKALEVGRSIIDAKIKGQRNHLEMHRKKINGESYSSFQQQIKVSLKNLKEVGTINQLFGVEGACAKQYFVNFNDCLTKHTFVKRERRPAYDIVNALLNLSYMISLRVILTNAMSLGFDTEIGIIHGIRYGRESLALDLLECFRPAIDHFVIKMLNLNKIGEEDYTIDVEDGCRLTTIGIKRFINLYEKFLGEDGEIVDLKKEDLRQQRRLKKYMLGEIQEVRMYCYG